MLWLPLLRRAGVALALAVALGFGCGGKQDVPDQAGPGPDTSQTPRTDGWGETQDADGFAPIPLPDGSNGSDGSDVADVEVVAACVPGGCLDDGNPCTWDFCDGTACVQSIDFADPLCCVTGADCDDGDPVTPDVCKDFQCTHECQENCCWISEDCDDGNECTCDHCEFGKCYHSTDWNLDPFCVPPPAECCIVNPDCDDSEACTLDFCLSGTCIHKAAFQNPEC